MRFHPTRLTGVYIVEPEAFEDERGMFARTFCAREFREQGLIETFVQCNTSWNGRRGTLRGLHYQLPPAAEVKLVRCTSGAVWDVVVDLRSDSPTYLQHIGVELSATNRLALYIPGMCAHGFQTLVDGSEIFYQMSEFYAPEAARGLHYDDRKLGISWPVGDPILSDRDRSWSKLP